MSIMAGGVPEVEGFQEDMIDELGRFAVDEYNKKQNKHLEYVKVVKVKKQIVAGILYDVTLETKEHLLPIKKTTYEAKVWVKPWMNFKELQDFKEVGDLASSTSSDHLGAKQGGVVESEEFSKDTIDELGRFAVDEYNKKKENEALEYVKVLKVKEKVVEGILFELTLEAKEHLLPDKKKTYEAKVWVKPWMNFKELQDFKEVGDSVLSSTSS